ncbi:ABC transporter permease [Glaciibacter psychrotolerans]|uniref:Ribose/xylose/arabinose/galactoside ABC-type transport system permease subunit n=1 Tax=Glaciibacter psychrotolerans TaxID=670054 RepID=A0A7Z0EHM9_9MICO|nr:ABC transporter permease [Leifsonia psychrotolerans]NYJ21658.1 ribose/xylose/arabinose/galactoside ABC-type transport system permease subunit [Leifsonia psychrotolerans]
MKVNSRWLMRWLVKQRQNPTIATLAILATLVVVFSLMSDRFLTIENIQNVTRSSAAVITVGCAVTLVMIARGLDLSVGSTLAACGVLAAALASNGANLLLSYLAALALGAAIGALNGVIVVGLKVTPIIATLGTLNIARGLAYLITPSAILVGLPAAWSTIGTSSLFGLPSPVLIAIAAVIFFSWLLNRTVFGRHVYAIGGNEETARLAGVRVGRVLFLLYLMAGLSAGVGAIVLSSRLGTGDPNIGVGFEFDVIVAVILGGTSLAGGSGRISGTVLGALIVGFLSNGLNLVGVEPFWQYVAKGSALIVAVVLDRFASRSSDVRPKTGKTPPSPPSRPTPDVTVGALDSSTVGATR